MMPKKKTMKQKEKELQMLSDKIKWFEDYEIVTRSERAERERERDAYDNIQWTAEELAKLRQRRQPIITINRIKPKIDTLVGLVINTATDPKALPRTPRHEEDATAVTEALRYVADKSDLTRIRGQVAKDMAISGLGVMKQELKADGQDRINIHIKHVPWDRYFYDPYSKRQDMSDCKYMGEVMWIDAEDAKEIFPEGVEAIDQCLTDSQSTPLETHDDTKRILWADTKRKRIRLVEMWYKVGNEWYECIFVKGGFLVEPKKSTLKDEDGMTMHPYSPMSLNVRLDGTRYGVVTQYMSLQEEINKRRSKALHLLTMRQSRIGKTFEADVNKFKRELTKPDGMIVADRGEFDILPTNDLTAGQLSLLQEAKVEIDSSGVDAGIRSLGDRASARSLQARVQTGISEFSPMLESMKHQQRVVMEKVWMAIKRFWTEEKWLRVTDDPRNSKFVGLNKRLTNREALELELGEPILMDDPVLDLPSDVILNDVSKMDVDIIIQEGPDIATMQAEQFENIANVLPVLVNAKPDLAGPLAEALFEASDIKDKDRILRIVRGEEPSPEEAQITLQNQLALENAALDLQQKQANIEKTQAETVKRRTESEANLVETTRAAQGKENIG